MVDPIAVGLTKEYTAKSDTDNPTIWLIGPLDSITKSKILAKNIKIKTVDGKPELSNEFDLAGNDFNIVKYGLKGFRNFQLSGVEVEFKTKKERLYDIDIDIVSDETLGKIPLYIIRELADAIWGENQVSGELAKN